MFAETITEPEIRLNTIEEAIEDIKSGKNPHSSG
jgi:hypothetical protein